MKTDRFDEEFRRKLLGLPAEADPGEVERIQGFVKANQPTLPGFGWGKLLLYGGSSLLLIGSLSYNVIQTYRNTHLQSSIDSLTHQPVVQATPNQGVRHDTVYITRSGSTQEIGAKSVPGTAPETVENEPVEQVNATQLDEIGRKGSVATGDTKSPQSGDEVRSSQPEATSLRPALRSTNKVATAESAAPSQRGEKSSQVRTEVDSLAATSPIISSGRLLTEKANPTTRTKRINKPAPAGVEKVEGLSVNDRISSAGRAESRRRNNVKGRQTILPANENSGLLVTDQSHKQNRQTSSNPPTSGFTPVITENANSNASIPEINRQTIPAEPLASLQASTTSTKLAIISPSHSLVVPKNELAVKATRRPWHLTMPNLSVPNAEYRLGVGLMGGSDQAGGALLGEIMLNRHWSVQTGLQLGYKQGFHYRDEQDFNEHQKEDFRQTYAPQLSSSSDIQDINQMTLLVQVPIQVAYHFPLGRQWGIRLGLGTELKLWERSTVSFDYQESSRSSEHELSRSKDHVHTINNLILSTAIERSWKKWQFRAGPFISPQLRSTGNKPDDLSWGANLQVFYRLGK
ncbi:hypothetical protein GO755_12895 [Spirosoma sp. HMF4905]|uniref:Outer membrane protein beta-barrel domain-containing protein n=1 Tax=Spirosoma arboris TaxID=2682092 RepID=A0A7K1SAS4_9BACT|nr:hypothetical protein [Spirosoma arboris]MVM30932.1 hypothetical protein [Spirosoma arboris]